MSKQFVMIDPIEEERFYAKFITTYLILMFYHPVSGSHRILISTRAKSLIVDDHISNAMIGVFEEHWWCLLENVHMFWMFGQLCWYLVDSDGVG